VGYGLLESGWKVKSIAGSARVSSDVNSKREGGHSVHTDLAGNKTPSSTILIYRNFLL
jgi:hypothetical protein